MRISTLDSEHVTEANSLDTDQGLHFWHNTLEYSVFSYWIHILQLQSKIYHANLQEMDHADYKNHPRGRNFNQGLGKSRPWLKFLPLWWAFPVLHGHSRWIRFLPPVRGLLSFPPTFKWIVLRSCEIEVSHMGKKPISYRQRCENNLSLEQNNQEPNNQAQPVESPIPITK